jgi:hypothetical protein
LRFNVWYLTLLSFLVFPFHLLIGYGYNPNNFVDYLTKPKDTITLILNLLQCLKASSLCS